MRSASASHGGGTHTIFVDITVVPRVLVDHMDIGYWTGSAVDVSGPDPGANPDPPNPDDDYKTDCPNPPLNYPREPRVRAIGNFIHHVDPYGIVTGRGAFTLADANVMYDVHITRSRRTAPSDPAISRFTI
jgi:hypothetical protein